MARRHMVAQGFSPGVEMYKYGNPDVRRGGIMSVHQYVASLCATPPSGGVRFVFFAIPTGFVRVAHSTPWLLYAASPYGEALKFRSPVGSPTSNLSSIIGSLTRTPILQAGAFYPPPATHRFRIQRTKVGNCFNSEKTPCAAPRSCAQPRGLGRSMSNSLTPAPPTVNC